jgi:lipid-binding SYLF domain-containing protein
MRQLLAAFMAMLLVGSIAATSMAGANDEADRMANSTTTVKEVLSIPEDGIPQSMVDNAAAIVVIPGLIKAGFIAGAKHGNGVMSVRGEQGWSHPTFVTMTGGSVGWQAGVESTDLVLVFMSEKSVKALLNGEFTLGADASVAAGPVGRQASAGTNLTAQAEIYTYSRSRGVFAGIAIDGSHLGIDNDANVRYYGEGTKANDLLFGTHAKAPEGAEVFKVTLNDMTTKKKS